MFWGTDSFVTFQPTTERLFLANEQSFDKNMLGRREEIAQNK